jgi:hypothetical protein
VRPTSEDRDFYDADVPTDAHPSRLREVVLAQAFEPGGAVVLLFTSATLTDSGSGSGTPDVVEETARELELGDVLPDLFTADAYLLQSALGERLLPGDA